MISKSWNGVGLETKPAHALYFATKGLGAEGKMGADLGHHSCLHRTERWACPGALEDKATTCVCLEGWRSERAREKG